MTGDPTNVCGAKENLITLRDKIESHSRSVRGIDHVSAGGMANTLWFASGPAGVEQEKQIFRVHFFAGTFRRLL